MKMYHLIVNPIAKGGKLAKEWPNLLDYIKSKISNYQVYFTEYHGHATEIVKQLTTTNTPISIIAIGGDGTVNEVINGIVNHKMTTIGYIPFGSGMDFARGNDIPLEPYEAIDRIVDNNVKSIKRSKIIGDHSLERYFASNCGIGFDAEVSSEASVEKTSFKKIFNAFNLGRLIYVYIVIKQLFTFKRISLQVRVDGELTTYNNAWFVTFSNNPYVGGGMKMNPLANPTEPILDATIASNLHSGQILALFPRIYKGSHIHHAGVTLQKGIVYEVLTNRPVEAHVDGEVIGKYQNFRIELQKDRLNLYY